MVRDQARPSPIISWKLSHHAHARIVVFTGLIRAREKNPVHIRKLGQAVANELVEQSAQSGPAKRIFTEH
jgi:hypothetical protein